MITPLSQTSMDQKKKFIVSIDVAADMAEPDSKIARFFGVPTSRLMYKEIDNVVYWWAMSDLAQDQPLESHLRNLIEKTHGHANNVDPDAIKSVTLNIGIMFYETLTCTISIPVVLLRVLEERFPGLRVSISTYPTSDDE